MNKKLAWGSAIVVLGGVYAGATWYAGERAQQRYQEALEEVRKVLGAEGVVSQQYQRGFWVSQAQTVLQWTPPAEPAEEGATPVPATPLRLRLDSTVRHGPLAGFKLAAAVVETRMALDGLDEQARKLLERTSAPTLTVVHHWTGSNDLLLEVPAGEVAEGDNLIRWKALRYDMALSADRTRLRGAMQWPELTLRVHDAPSDAQDDEEQEGQEAKVPSTLSMAFLGLRGDFDVRIEDGLWLLTPGTSQGRIDKLTLELEEQGAKSKALAALQDMDFKATIERKDAVFGWNVTMQSKGNIGPMALDRLSLREDVSRIDVEAVRLFQQALVGAYRAGTAADAKDALVPSEAPWLATLAQAAPRLLAALPAYAVEIKATAAGKEGSLSYGAQIKSAPDQALVEEKGWGAALLQHSVLDASVRLPKAWIPLIAEAAGKPVPAPDEVNALLGMAQAQGFLSQETDHIVSSVQVEAGTVRLNGKAIQMPQLGAAQ